jgi:presenilin 1
MIAMVFLGIPDWTIWILLILLVFYDAIVVLCPHGLLNILVKKSEERGDEIPALVYSSAPWYGAECEESES